MYYFYRVYNNMFISYKHKIALYVIIYVIKCHENYVLNLVVKKPELAGQINV